MTDIFPTLYQLAGLEPARLYKDPTFDGRSLVALLSGSQSQDYRKEAIYWHYPFNVIVPDPTDGLPGGPVSAMRKGRYKIVVRWHRDIQLFDIERDPFERHDLAHAKPAIRDRMFGELVTWLRDNIAPQYFPQDVSGFDPANDPRGAARPLNDLVTVKSLELRRGGTASAVTR